jgi:hypothetical protein
LVTPIQTAVGSSDPLRANLRCQALLDLQRSSQGWWRQERERRDRAMQRAEPIDTADALRKASRTPGQIVVDDALRVLEVEALTQQVRGNEDVGL